MSGGNMMVNDFAQEKEGLIKEIKTTERWYRREASFFNILWVFGTIAIIVLSALTSILVAACFGKDAEVGSKQHLVLILLPAAASLLTSILVQFRVRENWQLRVLGFLDVADIVVEAQKMAPNQDEASFRTAKAGLRSKVIAVHRSQVGQFFNYLAQKIEGAEARAK